MDNTSLTDTDQQAQRKRAARKMRRHEVVLARCPVCGFFGLAADLARAIALNPALCRGNSKRSN